MILEIALQSFLGFIVSDNKAYLLASKLQDFKSDSS